MTAPQQSLFSFPSTDDVRAFVESVAPRDLVIENFRMQRMKRSDAGVARVLYSAETATRGSKALYVFAQLVEREPGQKKAKRLNESVPASGNPKPLYGFPQAAFYSERLKLLIQIFPADRQLPFLRQASDPETMKPVLQQMLSGGVSDVESLDIDVVQYKPERKCLFRYYLEWTTSGAQLPQVCYAKVFRKAGSVYQKLHAIRRAYKGEFTIPEPLGWVRPLHMIVLSSLDGGPLSLSFPRRDLPELCRTIASGLSAFHRTRVTLSARSNTQLGPPRPNGWIRDLAKALPELGREIRDVAGVHARRSSKRAHTRAELVHGDFHVANILVGPSGLGLVDFENAHLGNPATDVASFCAQLKLLSLKLFQHHSGLDDGLHAFLDEYFGQRPWCRQEVEMYYAFYCLWCANFQCIARPEKRGWRERALTMAELALASSKGAVLDD